MVAHELAKAGPRPVCLLFRTAEKAEKFRQAGGVMKMRRLRGKEVYTSQASVLADTIGLQKQTSKKISDLIIATKAHRTAVALTPYLEHITPETNIFICQNGMGMADNLRARFWPEANAPRMFPVVTDHGAYKKGTDTVFHTGVGQMRVGGDTGDKPELVQQLQKSRDLHVSMVPKADIELAMMEKLVVNACINPLTAVMNCKNGDLLLAQNSRKVFEQVISEAVAVFDKEYPDVLSLPGARTVLNKANLLTKVLRTCKITAENSLSMREDIRNHRQTEIDFINGHLTYLGRKHGLKCSMNNQLLRMVADKLAIDRLTEQKLFKEQLERSL